MRLILIQMCVFRMEKLELKKSSSLAKSVGALVSVAGAFVVTFYKGPPIMFSSSFSDSSNQIFSSQSHWVLGGFLLADESLLASMWYILQVSFPFSFGAEIKFKTKTQIINILFPLLLQATILKKHPAVLTITFFYCFFISIISLAISLVAEQDPSAWRLKLDVGLLAVLYSVSKQQIPLILLHFQAQCNAYPLLFTSVGESHCRGYIYTHAYLVTKLNFPLRRQLLEM